MTAWIPNIGEGVLLALGTMRANKLRSSLTVLGVVIGVTTVMMMASLVEGIRSQIFASIENASPETFYVIRFYSATPLNPQNLPPEVRARPVVSASDAAALQRVPVIRHAGLWVQISQRMDYQGEHSQALTIWGADNSYLDVQGGTLLEGRWFSTSELNAGSPVIVIEQDVAHKLFGTLDALGNVVRIGGKSFTVIGVFAHPDNIFQPPGTQDGAVAPFLAIQQNYHYDDTNALFIIVVGQHGVSVDEAKDAAIAALRRARGLRPGVENNFDLLTQDQILGIVDKLTSAFFMVMIALSSVALLVGGIGVMAIMMVSVTDRTREIGVRKALGATRTEILWQFLVEAATLTAVGGLLGIAVGLLGGELLKSVLGIKSGPPIWSAVIATLVSVGIGLVFGVVPANRAARLDPVEALRYE
ncbi:MAG TPA: ABC transporter permease [Gemmatimonadales bacterium]|nr:ABC transporter permease [Gemmatimonadales bacterium]